MIPETAATLQEMTTEAEEAVNAAQSFEQLKAASLNLLANAKGRLDHAASDLVSEGAFWRDAAAEAKRSAE